MTISASPSPTIFLGFLKNSNRRCSRSGRGIDRRSVPVNDYAVEFNRVRSRRGNKEEVVRGSSISLVLPDRVDVSSD